MYGLIQRIKFYRSNSPGPVIHLLQTNVIVTGGSIKNIRKGNEKSLFGSTKTPPNTKQLYNETLSCNEEDIKMT
jgi:hypothetical protein